jgi:hypothetical protein
MWTPSKNYLQEQAKAQRMCFTEQKERIINTEPAEYLSDSQLEQTRLKEGKHADGTISMFETCKVKKNKEALRYEDITYRNNGKIYSFPVFNDNEIGFQAISNKLIPTVPLQINSEGR